MWDPETLSSVICLQMPGLLHPRLVSPRHVPNLPHPVFVSLGGWNVFNPMGLQPPFIVIGLANYIKPDHLYSQTRNPVPFLEWSRWSENNDFGSTAATSLRVGAVVDPEVDPEVVLGFLEEQRIIQS